MNELVTPAAPSQPTSVAVAAAQSSAVAEVHAMYSVAAHNRRIPELVRQALIKECRTPSFAERAVYTLPFGGKEVRGPSVRFTEAYARAARNFWCRDSIVSVTPTHTVVEVAVIDLEAMHVETAQVAVTPTVERKDPGDREIISQRVNSEGKPTFTVRASDSEMLGKTRSAISKLRRNLMLKFVTFDLLAECGKIVAETNENEAAQHPEEARRKLVDAFGELGVPADQLVEAIGQPIESLSPKQIAEWREIYTAINEGHATWADVRAATMPQPTATDDTPATPSRESLLARVRSVQGGTPKPAQAPPAATPANENKPDPVEAGEERARVIDALNEWVETKRPEVGATIRKHMAAVGKDKISEMTTAQVSAIVKELRQLDTKKKT
ncbi:MAG: hypothetical protein EKK55_00950 [Rhodocyclaceae bacterium]|nr:MAG: hypothetical protein EKK55_00950 [Rhodocyclaceae bacterium]